MIPFSHHPLYTAGPDHEPDAEMQDALLPLFARAGVRLVAGSGHEHNFQVSEADGRCVRRLRCLGTAGREGARAGSRRHTPPRGAPRRTCCSSRWTDRRSRVTPVSGLLPGGLLHRMTALTPRNEIVEPPIVVRND